MKCCCCFKSHRETLKSLIKRRSSSLEPLDGIRALAILWVIPHNFMACWIITPKCKTSQYYTFQAIANGDLAVDMFFVLSGYLISYLLNKEYMKYEGKIDYFHFYRSRFWRLWPVLLCHTILLQLMMWQDPDHWYMLKDLLFINNMPQEFLGKFMMSHTWSLAVEF